MEYDHDKPLHPLKRFFCKKVRDKSFLIAKDYIKEGFIYAKSITAACYSHRRFYDGIHLRRRGQSVSVALPFGRHLHRDRTRGADARTREVFLCEASLLLQGLQVRDLRRV